MEEHFTEDLYREFIRPKYIKKKKRSRCCHCFSFFTNYNGNVSNEGKIRRGTTI